MWTSPNPTALTGVPAKRTPGSPVPAGRRQLYLRFPTGAWTCQSFQGLEGGAGGNKSLSASTSTGTFYTARATGARGKQGAGFAARRAAARRHQGSPTAPAGPEPPGPAGTECVGLSVRSSGGGIPGNGGPDRPQGCPSPACPGGQRPRSHARDALPSSASLCPTAPAPAADPVRRRHSRFPRPERHQGGKAHAGLPGTRARRRFPSLPFSSLPFPPPPARPSLIHRRIQRPRPRRAASPRG